MGSKVTKNIRSLRSQAKKYVVKKNNKEAKDEGQASSIDVNFLSHKNKLGLID
jgi:hypothetical protein